MTTTTTPASAPVAARLQHRDHRDDREKDAGEELGDLDDRFPVEGVVLAYRARRQRQREQRQADQQRVAQHVLQLERASPSDVELDARFHRPDISTAPITPAISRRLNEPSIAKLVGHRRCGDTRLLAIEPGVDQPEKREQSTGEHRSRKRELARRPEEVDTLEEADEERRIAQWRERAADVADQNDEEHHRMHLVPPMLVGGKQRADQQHRRAGRSHDARERRAERQDAGVERGCTDDRAAHADAARDREKREQDRDERQVLEQYGVRDLMHGFRRTEYERERREQRERPPRSHLPKVIVPERRGGQRHQGDRQQ